MNRAFVSCLCLVLPLLLGSAPARSQSPSQPLVGQTRPPRPSEDVPSTSWTYDALYILYRAGVPTAIPAYGIHRAWTRSAFATGIGPALSTLTASDQAARQDLQTRLQENPSALDALRRLVDEFQPELEAQGQNVSAVLARLAALPPIAPPFPDVPKSHWAYSSVEALRKAGIIVGEGSGGYGG